MGRAAKIFAEQLGIFHYGHPLWYPEPTSGLDGKEHEVHIGDVGYIDEDGAFCRLFNITFDVDHALNKGGVPGGFAPLSFDHNRLIKVKKNFLNPGPLCSRSVNGRQLDAHAAAAVAGMAGAGFSYRFKCTNQEGALLVLMDNATKSSLDLNDIFEEYMLRNHESWYSFARSPNTLGIRCSPEDIILVRGTVKTSAWAVAAFFDAGNQTHEVSFDGHFSEFASAGMKYWQLRRTVCSFEQRVSPYNPTLPVDSDATVRPPVPDVDDPSSPSKPNADQCVFLNYYKVKYRKFRPKKLLANAKVSGQSKPAKGDHGQPIASDKASSGAEIEQDVKQATPRLPIDDILEYILEQSDAEVAIASYNDVEDLTTGASWSADIVRSQSPVVTVFDKSIGKLLVNKPDQVSPSHDADTQPTIALPKELDYPELSPTSDDSFYSPGDVCDPLTKLGLAESNLTERARRISSVLNKAKFHTQTVLHAKPRLPWDPHADTHPLPGESHSLLDFLYPVHVPGIVIPQVAYNSFIPFHPMATIRFSERGKPGVKLINALEGGLGDLNDPHRRCLLAHSSDKVLIRVNWPGYPTQSRSVNVVDDAPILRTSPLTKRVLVSRISRAIATCFEDLQKIKSKDASSDWLTTNHSFGRLVLLELRHVSLAIWQPVLCVI